MDQIEAYAETISTLASLAANEEMFTHIYQGNLANRLLELHSHSEEAERIMLNKLRVCKEGIQCSQCCHVVWCVLVVLVIDRKMWGGR